MALTSPEEFLDGDGEVWRARSSELRLEITLLRGRLEEALEAIAVLSGP